MASKSNWRRFGGIFLGIGALLISFTAGWIKGSVTSGSEPAFYTRESTVDFENEKWILKTESVHRSGGFLDVNRWVVTLTDKASGQSLALLTAHPSFQKEPWTDMPLFSQTPDGFRYACDICSLVMKWPEIDFNFEKASIQDSDLARHFTWVRPGTDDFASHVARLLLLATIRTPCLMHAQTTSSKSVTSPVSLTG